MKESLKEKAMLGITAGRLFQAYDYARKVNNGESVARLTAAIVGIDQADGMIARKLGVDGPKRRVLDSIVDSAIIGAGLISVFKKNRQARPIAGLLLVREVFVATGWARDLVETQQPKRGDIFYKLPHLTVAAFCLSANEGSSRSTNITGAAALAVNAQLAYDYHMGWKHPERTTMLDTGVVEVQGLTNVRSVLGKLSNPQLLLDSSIQPLQLTEGAAADYIDSTCEDMPDIDT